MCLYVDLDYVRGAILCFSVLFLYDVLKQKAPEMKPHIFLLSIRMSSIS